MEEFQDRGRVADIARIRFAMVFLGRVHASGEFRGLSEFKDWLAANYGPPLAHALATDPSEVVKRNNNVEPFDISKLEKSIGIASKGRGSDDEVRALAARVASTAVAGLRGQAIVTSQQLASEVLKILHARDAVAYLRYASAVKRYRSVNDFWKDALAMDEIDVRRANGQ